MTKRTRVIAIAVWAAAMVAAIAYLQFGKSPSSAPAKPTSRCKIVINARGLAVDGTETNRDVAVELCKKVGGADITVGSDAKRPDVLQLTGQLTAAHVDVLSHN
jgi:hypothetical protein